MAAARRQRRVSELAALVDEVFGGRPAPSLPECVIAALDEYAVARSRSSVVPDRIAG
jgi:hypothetical protein